HSIMGQVAPWTLAAGHTICNGCYNSLWSARSGLLRVSDPRTLQSVQTEFTFRPGVKAEYDRRCSASLYKSSCVPELVAGPRTCHGRTALATAAAASRLFNASSRPQVATKKIARSTPASR